MAAAYGNLSAANFSAGHDVSLLWSRGDLSGTVTATGDIQEVDSYGSINASLSGANVGTVSAYGPIAGSITATGTITFVDSGGDVTATVQAPTVTGIAAFDHTVLTDYPETPVLSVAADLAQMADTRNQLEAAKAAIAQADQGAVAEVAADKAFDAPNYLTSIGDQAAAAAAFQQARVELLTQIARATRTPPRWWSPTGRSRWATCFARLRSRRAWMNRATRA